jgi:hypothetical protein
MRMIVLKGDMLYIIRRRRKEEIAHFDIFL